MTDRSACAGAPARARVADRFHAPAGAARAGATDGSTARAHAARPRSPGASHRAAYAPARSGDTGRIDRIVEEAPTAALPQIRTTANPSQVRMTMYLEKIDPKSTFDASPATSRSAPTDLVSHSNARLPAGLRNSAAIAPMSGASSGREGRSGTTRMAYDIDWSDDAKADMELVPIFHRRKVFTAVKRLRHDALTETLQRKALTAPLDDFPDASWRVRIGPYRAYYRVDQGQTVVILRVILKGSSTTADAVARGRRK